MKEFQLYSTTEVILVTILFVFTSFSVNGNCQEELKRTRTCTARPNIVFIVADDAGWNDFSFHGSPQIPTPNIDALALSGIILNNYYAAPLCTPSRGAIMTGKHPIHLRLQHYVLMGGSIGGLPLNEKIFPQYLKELGYKTHLIGKWHLGHSSKFYTPIYRGFDSHFGYWLGVQDYNDHFANDAKGTWGYDFRRNMSVNYDAFGIYDTDLFTEEAIKLIQSHETSQPLFLMLNHIAPHSSNKYNPLQAPERNILKFSKTIDNVSRRIYAGIVDKLDESVGLIIDELLKARMLDNTIIVFTSDNGGAPEGFDLNHGSNWPLRGVKNTLWEGGTRIAGLIWSPFLLPNKVSNDMMHIQDWLPTLYEGIGGNLSRLGQIDGLSQWNAMKTSLGPIRKEFLYNIDDIYNNSAIRVGPWKVIQGNTSPPDLGAQLKQWDGWYGPSGRGSNISVQDLIPLILNCTSAKAMTEIGVLFNETEMRGIQEKAEVKCEQRQTNNNYTSLSCDPYNNPCLFNVENDPCEYNNLADEEPLILNTLLSILQEYNKTALSPNPRIWNPESNPKNWDYTWTNWQDFIN